MFLPYVAGIVTGQDIYLVIAEILGLFFLLWAKECLEKNSPRCQAAQKNKCSVARNLDASELPNKVQEN